MALRIIGKDNIHKLEIGSDGAALVQLAGSIPEYGWLSTDNEPTPADPSKFAMGVEVDVTTNILSVKYWNGSAWVGVK